MHPWKVRVGGMTDLGSLYMCHSPSHPSPTAPGEVQYSHSLLCLSTSHCFIPLLCLCTLDTRKIKLQRDLSRSCKLTFRSCLPLSLLFLVPKQTLPPLFLVPKQTPLRGAVVHKLSRGVCGEHVFGMPPFTGKSCLLWVECAVPSAWCGN